MGIGSETSPSCLTKYSPPSKGIAPSPSLLISFVTYFRESNTSRKFLTAMPAGWNTKPKRTILRQPLRRFSTESSTTSSMVSLEW